MSRGSDAVTGTFLEVENLCKTFRTEEKLIEVLKGVDLVVEEGQTIAILGSSGVGKTTLLHILGTLDRPSSGSVRYRGEDPFQKNDRQLAAFRNRHIGFVFQFHHLLPEFSALENVMMPALIAGLPKKEAAERAAALLVELGLGERLSHRPGKLSGGEQQRVAVARALVMQPRVVLADEPTGNLDTRTADTVQELMVSLSRKKGVTLIVVTHNPRFASRMDRHLEMVDGRLVGEPERGL
jgi:lipoprotein-releasing system ATP-binding protein